VLAAGAPYDGIMMDTATGASTLQVGTDPIPTMRSDQPAQAQNAALAGTNGADMVGVLFLFGPRCKY